jgi:hypothetical protein
VSFQFRGLTNSEILAIGRALLARLELFLPPALLICSFGGKTVEIFFFFFFLEVLPNRSKQRALIEFLLSTVRQLSKMQKCGFVERLELGFISRQHVQPSS